MQGPITQASCEVVFLGPEASWGVASNVASKEMRGDERR
jgi:hypothetical protein